MHHLNHTNKSKINKKLKPAKKMVIRNSNKNIIEKSKKLRNKRLPIEQISPVRIQKILSYSGFGSRRKIEEFIINKKITINGAIAKLGDKITYKDKVLLNNKHINILWPDRIPRIIIYNKPEGEIVTRYDPQGRITVYDRLPNLSSKRWLNIGRLDINTSGLLIFTTSGDIVNRFAHPKFAIDREYLVRVNGNLTDSQMDKLITDGLILDDGTKFKVISIQKSLNSNSDEKKNNWYKIIVQEGKNKEIRKIFDYYNLKISRLMRIRFGPVAIPPRLKKGQFYELNELEIEYVLKNI